MGVNSAHYFKQLKVKKLQAIIFVLVFYCVVNQMGAQGTNDYIKVTYKLRTESNNNSKPQKHKEIIENLFKISKELEFELIANEQLGVYQYNKKLEIGEDDIIYKLAVNLGGGNSIYYRTLNKKIMHVQDFGKKINVVYDPNELNWEIITEETKKIMGYTCYKAIGYKEQYDLGRKKTLTFSPVAWFAPELDLPYGPKGIDGLPGLVLEGSMNGKLFFYADKIEANAKLKNGKNLKIEKGENLTETEYLELLQKMRPINN